MKRRLARMLLSVGLALALAIGVVASGGPASAAATVTVGLWNLNEASGARTAVDSSGNGQHGRVGSLVQTGVNSRTAYRFPSGTAAPAAPHLVIVPNSARLNPGGGDFSVEVRFRTTRAASNVVQKGQAGTAGGYWKVELHKGHATCLFRGGNGHQVAAGSTTRVDNGAWHTVRCDRTANSVAIVVDGVRQRSTAGSSGSVANTLELAIGGKSRCNQTTVGCDFFTGDIDYVRVLKA